MKILFSTIYFGWLIASAVLAGYSLATNFTVVWIGVLMTSLAPLLNQWWQFDNGSSPSVKARYPKVSLWVLLGVAWVLLTTPELNWPLWLVLGCLGGFLLHSYWAVDQER